MKFIIVKNLEYILRENSADKEYIREFSDGERMVRDSFDSLLVFYSKLEYLLKIQLINEQDIFFFLYFINKAADVPAVCKYVKIYNFQLDGMLNPNLKSGKKAPTSNKF
jgi:hypothetical protein